MRAAISSYSRTTRATTSATVRTSRTTARARTTAAAMATGNQRERVGTIFGTMTLGWRYASEACDDEASTAMLTTFVCERGQSAELDTAIAYAGGETERILGRAFAANAALRASDAVIDTKANPWPGGVMTQDAGRGGLSASELRAQVRQSVESLNGRKIRTLYLHAPDSETRLEDALRECERLRTEENAFEDLGLSNFSAWETVMACQICERNGWKRPTMYQGMYNALTRNVESELLSALRACRMRFVAYNPLAGGLLTGKYVGKRDADRLAGGRFDGNDMYKSRFFLECYHDAVDAVVEACRKHDIDPADAALRWMYNHSALDGSKGDAVIIGASSVKQLEANLASADVVEPLPRDVLDAFDDGWRACRSSSAPYFRGHCKLD